MTTSSLNPFFKKALESISSKILIADKNLKVIYLNSSAEDFLNTTLEESENQEISKIFTEKPKNDLELKELFENKGHLKSCLLYTSPSPRDGLLSRMPSSA